MNGEEKKVIHRAGWYYAQSRHIENNEKAEAAGIVPVEPEDFTEKDVDLFVEDIAKICIKHGLCLAHEDPQGSFLIQRIHLEEIGSHGIGWPFNTFSIEDKIKWLK